MPTQGRHPNQDMHKVVPHFISLFEVAMEMAGCRFAKTAQQPESSQSHPEVHPPTSPVPPSPVPLTWFNEDIFAIERGE